MLQNANVYDSASRHYRADGEPLLLPVLATKLHPPPLPPHPVQRPCLLAQLNQGLTRGHKLTLVVAPAGFGKTTLISQWLADLGAVRMPAHDESPRDVATSSPINRPTKIVNVAWLSLDEADNELARFLQYLVAAVQSVFPINGAHSMGLWHSPQLPPVSHLAAMLLREWGVLPGGCLLVLENYHCITETTIHQLLTQLLDHLPPQVHLVLISRTEPPLPLARLRVRQMMTEFRAADLGFSFAETQVFLTQALGHTLAADTVTTLHTQTEGWIAGLHLAALALRGRADETTFMQTFSANNRHVTDYLIQEVLARQPQPVQTFLMHTAILDRFCAPLCMAILSEDGEEERKRVGRLSSPLPSLPSTTGQAMLDYLAQANLFLTPLDDQGEWYRYHHLFRSLLHQRLQASASAAELAALHRRASAWLADHGWIEEAVLHALAAGDPLTAARLVEQHWHNLLNQQDLSTLKRWLALLPLEVTQQRPSLLAAQAWLANAQGRHFEIPVLAEQAEAALACMADKLDEQAAQLLRGDIDAVWALVVSGKAQTPAENLQLLDAAHRALTRVPVTHTYVYSTLTMGVGLGYVLAGQPKQALHFLQEKLNQTPHQTDLFRVRLQFLLSIIQLTAGNLAESLQTLLSLTAIATSNNFAFDLGWAYLLLGIIHYERNELAAAHRYFEDLVKLDQAVHFRAAFDGRFGLALIYQAQGQPAQSQAEVDRAFALSTTWRIATLQTNLPSFQARLLLCQGQVVAAARKLETITVLPPPGLMYVLEVPQLTQVRVLIAQASPTSLPAASALLRDLWALAETQHNVWRMCEILALEALIHQAQGQTESALATLARAVTLAKPGRFIRTFVDLGLRLAGLLYQLAAQGVEADYIGHLLAAFPPRPGAGDLAQHIRQAAQARLIEPLTERESEVLLHLQEGLPNKTIAQALNISLLTVKRHIANLYQKLGVQSRQQALVRARALGILPTT